MSSSVYKKALKLNSKATKSYYLKSQQKTEQQKFLENILDEIIRKDDFNQNQLIADIACGGGTLSYHLSQKFPKANFTLVDYNDDGLEIARSLNPGANFEFVNDNIFKLEKIPDSTYDFTFCWQTLSWIDEPHTVMDELLRITKKGGRIFLSSLFNSDHDVDIYAKVYDYTLESGKNAIPFSYNTYSALSLEKWLNGKVESYKIRPFNTEIDFEYTGRGIGTFTVMGQDKRLQISAGMLLNWAIVDIIK